MKRVIVIGGGLAGLVTAIQLARAGISCLVIEKKAYPVHRVCGEYISNEVVPFLKSSKLFPSIFNPPEIREFLLSAVDGRKELMPLDLGGFGISRYSFDNFLYEQARSIGVEFSLNEEVDGVQFRNDHFEITSNMRKWQADVVVGTFGKRSKIDHLLKRSFIYRRSPYIGVKYHVRTDHPKSLIALHNFAGGYCGMSNIEDGKTTICYLSHRDNLKRSGSIAKMEKEVIFKNPLIEEAFRNAEFLFEKPEVINEISFETKHPLENHMLMAGDAAGMIAPLCGNGMAMAIRSGKIASECVIRYVSEEGFTREMMEQAYQSEWNHHFRAHLWRGRQIQKLFGNASASKVAINLAIYIKPLAKFIMRSTHGEPF